MKKIKNLLISCSITLVLVSMATYANEKPKDYGSAKNVIIMIPDGMSIEALTTVRWMTDNYSFTFDSWATGLVKTNNSSTPIADSAPAGTAMATGIKTESPFIGTYPTKAIMPGTKNFDENLVKSPIATVLEGAYRTGRSTGIVSTSNVQHATPAAYTSHYPDRKNYQILGEQQVYQNMSVVLGAGSKYLRPEQRKDGEDLITEIKNLGYDYINDTATLKATTSNKIWGMFAEENMAYDIDRDPIKEPSLAEMTKKAIETLSKNKKGFFLMVEGSEIDWAAHANDPVGVVSDIKAFDNAVKVAKEFADKNGDTVIIVASDHGTGGITFSANTNEGRYDKTPLEEFTHIIKNAKFTGAKAAELIEKNEKDIESIIEKIYGFRINLEETQKILEAKDKQKAIGQLVSSKSHIGWTTGGHVGGDVALYIYSTAKNTKKLMGTIHNSEIGEYTADLLDLDLDKLTKNLYVDAIPTFEKKGAKVEFVEKTPNNFELVITKGIQEIKVPMYKNYAIVNEKKIDLKGLTIFNGEKVYVPKSLIDMIE